MNAGIEAFTPYLARVRTLCVFAFAVNASLALVALLVLTALLAAFWMVRVIIFVATLLAVFADVIAIAAVNDLDGNNVFAVFATTTFDGDFATREVTTSGFALVVILVARLQVRWRFSYKLFACCFINNFPAAVFTITFIPDVAELSPWALVAIATMR